MEDIFSNFTARKHKWYHLVLGHLGMSLSDMISEHLYHPDIRKAADDTAGKFIPCQECKQIGRVYGNTADRVH
jgi:hypothetical protein